MLTTRHTQLDHSAPAVARIGPASDEPGIRRIVDEPTRPRLVDTDRLGKFGDAETRMLGEHTEHAVAREANMPEVTRMFVAACAMVCVATPTPMLTRGTLRASQPAQIGEGGIDAFSVCGGVADLTFGIHVCHHTFTCRDTCKCWARHQDHLSRQSEQQTLKGLEHMTNHNHDTNNRHERPLGHLAAVVSHRSRGAIHTALTEAGISRRDLRLLAVLEREPQTAEALEERRAARRERHPGGEHGERSEHGQKRHGGFRSGIHAGHGGHKRRARDEQGSDRAGRGIRHRMTLTEKLNDLTTRGLITAHTDGTLRVTEQGAALRESGRANLAAIKERSTAGISENDLETTRRTLAALAQNLAS